MVRMSNEEIREARRVGIPPALLVKIINGWKLPSEEMEEIRGYGKVYVPPYKREGVVVRPQLRDLPKRR